MNTKRGGARPGAGRPPVESPNPSQRIRVPLSHLPVVTSLLERLKKPEEYDWVEPMGQAYGDGLPLSMFPEIQCGFPSPASDYEETLSLEDVVIDSRHKEATYLVKAKGHSMVGAGIFDGDTLVVDRAQTPRKNGGSIVVAVVQGKATCKRLMFKPDGTPYLASENPHFENRVVAEGDEFELWGVVRYCLHALL